MRGAPQFLIIIRHGIAADPAYFDGPDEGRPLTQDGHEKTKKAFAGLTDLWIPNRIYTSDYVRAKETADILLKLVKKRFNLEPSYKTTETLQPGGDLSKWLQFITNEDIQTGDIVAVVSHEPLVSHLSEFHLGCQRLHIDFKKAAALVVRPIEWNSGELIGFLQPKPLRLLKD